MKIIIGIAILLLSLLIVEQLEPDMIFGSTNTQMTSDIA